MLPTYPLTVLRCRGHKAVKTFQLSLSGELERIQYSEGQTFFEVQQRPVSSLESLAAVLDELSRTDDQIIIRGVPKVAIRGTVRRNKVNFEEPENGCPFVMLDFDDVALPEGLNPLSVAAIDHVIAKLPEAFGEASYFFQFSSSAGIKRPDGRPLKSGLNAHVFFYLSRPVRGLVMRDFLGLHCLETGFYSWKDNSGGRPYLILGVDPAVLQNAVQPHYVGLPIIGAGVQCMDFPNGRQGSVTKAAYAVDVLTFRLNREKNFQTVKGEIRHRYLQERGFQRRTSYSRTPSGRIGATQNYQRPHAAQDATGGKAFLRAEPYGDDGAVRLFFEGETSSGSWFVKKVAPTLALRFGDFTTMPLIELSDGAYCHVRDDLGWFQDLPFHEHSLVNGYLPDLDQFIGEARNSLVLAPTGAGKTSAIVRFARCNPTLVVIYTAQTIALVQQMYDDLVAGGIPTVHYTRCHPDQLMTPGVYVTTNASLKRLVAMAQLQAKTYTLVVDEVHIALDDFMAAEAKARGFNDALARAARTIFLTATMTDVQITALLRMVSHACGGECPIHSFDPVKENPLIVRGVEHFGPDLLGTLAEYQAHKEAGQPIPRTVIFVDTSKHEAYRLMLQHFGLSEDAWVVSRPECLTDEIEAARISQLPILITSPLFAFGLNFDAQPEKLWAVFDHLPVDKNQVVQTLNRANRGRVACEVRLYHCSLNANPLSLPEDGLVKREVENVLETEIVGLQGVLESHYDIDRNSYLLLRQYERSTAKVLHELISADAIQNYRVVPEADNPRSSSVDKDKAEAFKAFFREGREHYAAEARRHAAIWGEETSQLLLHFLQESLEQMGGEAETGREIERRRVGWVMALCGLTESSRAEKVSVLRLLRLFGERAPFLSGQFSDQRTSEWRRAASEKALALVSLVDAMSNLRSGKWDGVDFAKRMFRGDLAKAISALAESVEKLTSWERVQEEMQALAQRSRGNASRAQRNEINKVMFAYAKDFLATVGVFFGTKVEGGRRVTDPASPIVPPWNFEAMKAALRRKAASLGQMPIRLREVAEYASRTEEGTISLETCRTCVHHRADTTCAIGRSAQMPYWDEVGEASCPDFGRYRSAG